MSRNGKFAFVASWYVALLVLVAIWVFPAMAWAQEAASSTAVGETTPAGEIMSMVVKILFSALAIVVSYLSTKAIKYFEKKTKIDVPAATEKMIFEWADKGVGYAHEKAHQLAQTAGRKMNGNEKLNIAMQFVSDLVKKYNIEPIAEEKLRRYIEAKLGEKRLEGDGGPTTSPTV